MCTDSLNYQTEVFLCWVDEGSNNSLTHSFRICNPCAVDVASGHIILVEPGDIEADSKLVVVDF